MIDENHDLLIKLNAKVDLLLDTIENNVIKVLNEKEDKAVIKILLDHAVIARTDHDT